jgi:hypothetical protein
MSTRSVLRDQTRRNNPGHDRYRPSTMKSARLPTWSLSMGAALSS